MSITCSDRFIACEKIEDGLLGKLWMLYDQEGWVYQLTHA